MKQTKTILVVGANGGVGGETCVALLRHGWRVRALARRPGSVEGIEWIQGDAMVATSSARARRTAGFRRGW